MEEYECLKCKHTWQEKTGPAICPYQGIEVVHTVECPNPECKHNYVKWLSFPEKWTCANDKWERL